MWDDPGETCGKESDKKPDLDAFIEQDILLRNARDAADTIEEALNSTGALITAGGYEVRISKKVYLDLVRAFVGKIKAANR